MFQYCFVFVYIDWFVFVGVDLYVIWVFGIYFWDCGMIVEWQYQCIYYYGNGKYLVNGIWYL